MIQFIHQYVSSIEAITLKSYDTEWISKIQGFSRNELDAFIQGKANVQLSEIDYNEESMIVYITYGIFLNITPLTSYNKIQKYPEMLIEDHEFKNGDMAMNILNIDLDFVESMFSDLTKVLRKTMRMCI